MGTPPPASSR
jgi:hypothetical protein